MTRCAQRLQWHAMLTVQHWRLSIRRGNACWAANCNNRIDHIVLKFVVLCHSICMFGWYSLRLRFRNLAILKLCSYSVVFMMLIVLWILAAVVLINFYDSHIKNVVDCHLFSCVISPYIFWVSTFCANTTVNHMCCVLMSLASVVVLLRFQNFHCQSLFTAHRNARIASSVLAMAIPSVCLSVCLSHAGIASQRLHVAQCSLHRQIAKCI